MRRSPFFRLIAAALFAIVTFAVPGDALAHGAAHHREHEGDPHHAGADPHDFGFAVSAPNHGHDHLHPRLDEAARTRVEGLTPFVALPVRVPEALAASSAHAAPPRRAALVRGDPPTGPPPRLRAPPAH